MATEIETPWSLESEVQRLSRCQSFAAALLNFRMIGAMNEPYILKEIYPWKRGGAETYVLAVEVVSSFCISRFILKALVGFTPGVEPSAQLENWLRRRDALAEADVKVPMLYASGDAMLVEEFIESDAIDYLIAVGRSGDRARLIREKLLTLCSHVVTRGFRPLNFLPNIRIQNHEPVWVDFGHDLGDASYAQRSESSVVAALDTEFARYVRELSIA